MSWQNFKLSEFDRQRRCRVFQLLKRERIRRKAYIDREDARRDVFNYIHNDLS